MPRPSDPSSAPELDTRQRYAHQHLAPERVPSEPPYPVDTRQQVPAGERGLVPLDEKGLTSQQQARRLGSNKFWALVVLCAAVILAVAIGTALGVSLNRKHSSSSPSSSPDSIPSPRTSGSTSPRASLASSPSTPTTQSTNTTGSSTSSISAAASVTATIDCPQSNGTLFTPPLLNSNTPGNLTFIKYCGLAAGATAVVQGYATTFDACIELCSDYNYQHGSVLCFSAGYVDGYPPPDNCWGTGGTWTYGYQDAGYAAEAGAAVLVNDPVWDSGGGPAQPTPTSSVSF